jgi:type VI protein secretion system component Hcp
MSRSTPGIAGGAKRIAQNSDLHVSKRPDDLSSQIFINAAKGTRFDSILIEFFDKNDALYLTYTLKNVIISSVQVAARGDFESITFDAETTTAKYF